MSSYYYGSQHHQPSASASQSSTSSHNHHGGRSRRAPRLSSSSHSHRQFRGVRSMKELTESPAVAAFRARFEAGRSFDLDDDLEFCPGLLTDDDLQSIHSASSDGSMSSGSSQSSPLQHQIQPAQQISASFSLSSSNPHTPTTGFQLNNSHHMKILQPSALRPRNSALPIVNPITGKSLASPPPSISPAMMHQRTYGQQRW